MVTELMARSFEETRELVREAFVYAYPLLLNYKTLYQHTQDASFPGYAGGFNRFRHYARPSTPDDTDIVTPNNDTPYSWFWLDLRREPFVLTVPPTDPNRYYVFPAHDLYTNYLPMIGTRATGNDGGSFLFSGPGWRGETPVGLPEVRSPSWIVGCLGRTGLDGPADVSRVRALQRGYRLTPLSEWEGKPPPAPVPERVFPSWHETRALGPHFLSYLNFLFEWIEAESSEADLHARMAQIGFCPGGDFDGGALSPAEREAFEAGIEDGLADIRAALVAARGSRGLFGDSAHHGTAYARRAAGVMVGIYGLPDEEAIYEAVGTDADGQGLVGSERYELRFPKESPAPARLFWSVTMYRLPEQLLVANPVDRYSIGDRSEGLRYEADGSLSIRIQQTSPGADLESNWLPAPPGPFYLVFRFYGPTDEALSGRWAVPALRRLVVERPG